MESHHTDALLGDKERSISCISIPVGGMTLLCGQKQKKAKGFSVETTFNEDHCFEGAGAFQVLLAQCDILASQHFGRKERNAAVLRFHSVHWILKTVLIR